MLYKVGKIRTLLFNGFYAEKVDVEAQILPGISSFTIVGMPNKCVVEARERIRGAFYSSDLTFPHSKILVNLSPAASYKNGTHYDLPIALSILNAMDQLKDLSNLLCIGELSLTGKIVGNYGAAMTIEHAIQNNCNLVMGSGVEQDLKEYNNLPQVFMSDSLKGIVFSINHDIYFK
jgi:magnesium chelatase family protein